MLESLLDQFDRRLSPAQLGWMYCHTPRRLAMSMALSRFRATVRYAARHSKFYRDQFAARGIDPAKVKKPEDLGDFFTTPDDIVANPTDFICRRPSIVFESSGTSGKNKQVYFDRAELSHIGQNMAAGLILMGITPEDRVHNAFDFSIWIPGLMCHHAMLAAGNFVQALGKVDPVESYRRLAQYGITVVIGEPTWLIRLTQLAEKDGYEKGNGGLSPHPLKLLIGGAEEMPADAVPWMKRVWGGATIKMGYGSVEQATGLGFQPCNNHDGYHTDYFNFQVEVIDKDADGFGELVFTTLTRRVMPLIRYRTRDVTRLDLAPCACGLPAPRIARIRGRRDELIVASGGNLYPLMFEKILMNVRGISTDWQVIFTLEKVREILTINVESDRADAESIEAEIHRSATDLYPDLMKNLALGIFEMRVKVHSLGSIRTSRKLKRMIDQRHFAPANEQPMTLREETV